MTNWVHELGKEWGHWLRKADALGAQISGTLGRIYEEGPAAAAIRDAYNSGKIPITQFPRRVDEFHRAWLKLPEDHAKLLFVEYKLRIPVREKWRLMGVKKGAYYRQRAQAHIQVAGYIEK